MKKTYRHDRLLVELDKAQVFPDDPGNGTPAMVSTKSGYSATYWCACGEGLLHRNGNFGGTVDLTEAEIKWLDDLNGEITDFLYR